MDLDLTGTECPVCFEIFAGKVFFCETGHSFCGKCKEKLTICPTCSKPMSSTRNFALETLVGQLLSRHQTRSDSLNCPLCNDHARLSIENEKHLIRHMQMHRTKFLSFSKSFVYDQDFDDVGQDVEFDFKWMEWNWKIFKFYAQVDRKEEVARFVMQTFNSSNRSYLFAVDNRRHIRKNKYVSNVCGLTTDREAFSSGPVSISLSEFQENPCGVFRVKVYCCIWENNQS